VSNTGGYISVSIGSTYMTLIPTVESYHTITLNNEWSVIKLNKRMRKRKASLKRTRQRQGKQKRKKRKTRRE
jgi:hypothetical protein